jgi:hypothetical protein
MVQIKVGFQLAVAEYFTSPLALVCFFAICDSGGLLAKVNMFIIVGMTVRWESATLWDHILGETYSNKLR